MFIFCKTPVRINNPNYARYLPGSQPFYYVPCGQCILCRLKARKEWTLRLRLEASLYEESCFVTLTYDEEHVPFEVCVRDIQLFIKRLRKNSKVLFRFYSVAEYGSLTERPHFHIILFGYPLKLIDKIVKSWDYGFKTISPLNENRCNYTCGYTQKKYDKRSDKSLYTLFPQLTYQERLQLYLNCGDILKKEYHKNLDPRRAEFATCSLGIGLGYLLKNYKKITEEFLINFGGKNYAIPRYFRKKINELDPSWSDKWKEHMQDYASKNLVGLFDKASMQYEDNELYSYDSHLDYLWDEYVKHRVDTIEAKRNLFKDKKKRYKEI